MNEKKSLKIDIIVWILIMCLAALAAFVMLRRDSARRFGAVSYGAFPAIEVTTVSGDAFNKHALRSHVWAVLRTQAAGSKEMLKQVYDVQHMTVSGKRFMNVLTFGADPEVLATPVNKFHYKILVLAPVVERAFTQSGATKDGQVLLLDQDAIIRGVYDLTSPDDFRSFRQDVSRLL